MMTDPSYPSIGAVSVHRYLPFIYVKEAVGKGGAPIRVYKIRTMRVHDAKEVTESYARGKDSLGKALDENRVTWMGKFLRRYWIDEIPQLVNLVKGDMRLVGIRPRGQIGWEGYPRKLYEEAIKSKPGLFGVQYAVPVDTFEESIETEMRYLKEREMSPFETDLIYLAKILIGILFRGVRSR